MSDYTTWEEDLIDDDQAELYNSTGGKLGDIRRVGGSWRVTYGDETIAFRPDKKSAQACLLKYHQTAEASGVLPPPER